MGTSVHVNMDQLNRKIPRLMKDLELSRDVIVDKACAFFLQSAAKDTLPKKVAADASDMTHRALRSVVTGGWKTAKDRFRVTIWGQKMPEVKYGTNAKLQAYRDIWFRGIGKMGWVGCIRFLKSKETIAKFKVGDKVQDKQSQISSVLFNKNSSGQYMVTLTNKAVGIGIYGKTAAAIALGRAHNRLKSWANAELKKKARQSWQA